jgi:DNA-binding beta-propeller fold protein YncE
MADPHGIVLDDVNNEIVVANHGQTSDGTSSFWTRRSGYEDLDSEREPLSAGRFEAPSITVHAASGTGDVLPKRTIQGARTKLNWPMGLAVDTVNNEIAIANNGDNSILIFRRSDEGDVQPVRVIKGKLTNIDRPMGIAIDARNNELWVANSGSHSAVVFGRTAKGNIAPKRVIRNAPAGTASGGFGNPMAVAYDSKREEILVPN